MKTEEVNIRLPDGQISRIKVQNIVMEDILFRTPLWGILVAILFGGVAYFMIWFILNIMEPYVKENMNKNKIENTGLKESSYINSLQNTRAKK